jgi:hypothetical protein
LSPLFFREIIRYQALKRGGRKVSLGLTFLLLAGSLPARAQTPAPEPLRLFGLGENIAEHTSLDSTTLYYEQRVYRTPLPGLLSVALLPAYRHVRTFVPLFQGVPMVAFQPEGQGIRTTALHRSDRRRYAAVNPFRGNRYLFDFSIKPEFTAQFGNFANPVEGKFNLLLQSQLFLARGLVLHWGLLVPVVNELDNQPLNLRPAPLYLNQFLALGSRHFASLSAGFFYNDRYGLQAQYRRFHPASNWSWGLEAGLTGFYFFPPGGLYYQPARSLLALADLSYRLPNPDLTVKLSGGQYLYQDRGLRLDLIRQFSQAEVGMYLMATRNGSTGGFQLAIPIPPGSVAHYRSVRLRTTEEFRWEYNYSRGYRIGETYRSGYQLDRLLRQYHGAFMRNQWPLAGQ